MKRLRKHKDKPKPKKPTPVRSYWQSVFEGVFFPYQESLRISGCVPSINPGRNPGESPATRAEGRIKPTQSDFITDVDLTVKHTLPPHHRRLFYHLVETVRISIPETQKYVFLIDRLGEAFKRRGIYPIKDYFSETYNRPERTTRNGSS